jgi:hypothetical protein
MKDRVARVYLLITIPELGKDLLPTVNFGHVMTCQDKFTSSAEHAFQPLAHVYDWPLHSLNPGFPILENFCLAWYGADLDVQLATVFGHHPVKVPPQISLTIFIGSALGQANHMRVPDA